MVQGAHRDFRLHPERSEESLLASISAWQVGTFDVVPHLGHSLSACPAPGGGGDVPAAPIVNGALRSRFFCCGAKIALAGFAGADFAQMFKTEDSRRVTIGELYLDRVVPHRIRALGSDARLVHRQ